MARSRLGPLALESRLGEDSTSSVWRAIHVSQRKALAVKIFSLPFGGTQEGRQEFAREWETLKRLRQASIARCYGGGFEAQDAYLAYEFIDGDSLEQRVARRGRLSWETVLDEAEMLAEALAYAHERQVIHGHLVPDKIRLLDGRPKILDYRVDRFGSTYKSNRPLTPFDLGFRAPELIKDPRQLSPKCDLYAFGALLFYALSGQPPLTGKSPAQVAAAAERVTPPKVASLVLDCPVFFSSLIAQLLDKSPTSRPHGAGAVVLALREVRRRAGEGASVVQHASAGFSPLKVDVDKDEAKALLGHLPPEPDEPTDDGSSFYERPWFLVTSLLAILAFAIWYLQPLSEAQLRSRAEELIERGGRTALGKAKDEYLEPLLERYPDSTHAAWARDQIDQIEMLEAERMLELKLSRGAKLSSEGERLYAQALQYEQFGDAATALDKYTSLVTLLEDEPQQRAFVNLARRQIARIREQGGAAGEAQRIVRSQLEEAQRLVADGKPLEARQIWYSIIELYQNNLEMAPLVQIAQQRLAGSENSAPPGDSDTRDRSNEGNP